MEQNRADDLIRERIRQAIQSNGGAKEIAQKTDIPLGTLNKYVAKTSTASFTNVAKIAAAIGISLEEIAYGETTTASKSVQQQPMSHFNLILELGAIVERTYKKAAIHLSGTAEKHEINSLHKELINVCDIHQEDIVKAVLPELEKRLYARLKEAKLEPGTGKREAS